MSRMTRDDISRDYIGWLNDEIIMRFSNQRFHQHSFDTCARYLKNFENTDNLFLKIQRKPDLVMIGTMTVYYSRHHGTADIGILVGHPEARGRGFGRDAWATVADWLMEAEGVRKVTAGTLRCNTAMVKLMEAAGMTLEAVRTSQELIDNEPQDMLLFARFRAE